jgi:hypothetical protein
MPIFRGRVGVVTSVVFNMKFRRLGCMMSGMSHVAMGGVSVVSSLFVTASFVVFGSFFVVMSGALVMLSGTMMMVGDFFRHLDLLRVGRRQHASSLDPNC